MTTSKLTIIKTCPNCCGTGVDYVTVDIEEDDFEYSEEMEGNCYDCNGTGLLYEDS